MEPALALLRKKTNEEWTENTSKCCEEDISGRSPGAEKTVRHWLVGRQYKPSLPQRGRHRKAQTSTIVQNGTKYDAGDSRSLQKVGAESENLKKEWKWQRGIIMTHLLSESQWNRGHFRMTKWESEKHRS